MKKIILIVIAVVICVSFAANVFARTITSGNIKIVTNENELRKFGCDYVETEIMGCFNPTLQVIAIRADVPLNNFMFVLAHELGHYFLQDIDTSEDAANNFAFWLLYGIGSDEQKEMFVKALQS